MEVLCQEIEQENLKWANTQYPNNTPDHVTPPEPAERLEVEFEPEALPQYMLLPADMRVQQTFVEKTRNGRTILSADASQLDDKWNFFERVAKRGLRQEQIVRIGAHAVAWLAECKVAMPVSTMDLLVDEDENILFLPFAGNPCQTCNAAEELRLTIADRFVGSKRNAQFLAGLYDVTVTKPIVLDSADIEKLADCPYELMSALSMSSPSYSSDEEIPDFDSAFPAENDEYPTRKRTIERTENRDRQKRPHLFIDLLLEEDYIIID